MGDTTWMQECLKLAQQAVGRTAPNPLVGSVVVRGDQVVGRGFHPRAGQPHAEVFALHAAGHLASGATLYVNLEPCHHRGRTPPCTQSILASGIRRVVIGMVDPNPLVAGRGIAALQAAGLEVLTGVLEKECQQLNRPFSHYLRTGWPLGIWKYAMTLDGKIASITGDSAWVSGEAARAEVQQLRNQVDGVIVGGQTLRRDDPRLTCRLPVGRNPLRIVLSRSLDFPRDRNLWDTEVAPTLVFTGPAHDPAMADFLIAQGVELHILPEIAPATVMPLLGRRGLLSVLWECGGDLAAQALHQGAIQKVVAFIAPKLIGGAGATTPLAGAGIARMQSAIPLHNVRFRPVAGDLLVEGEIVLSDTSWVTVNAGQVGF